MKTVLTSGYTFTASAKTLDFSGTTGFDVRRLLAVLNLTRGAVVYAVGTAGLGYSALTGSVVTLAFDTSAHANGDAMMVLYDAPNTGAQDATLQSILTALGAPVLASGAATEVTLQAIKAALLAQVDFESSLVTDGASFYVRRETANEGTGVITVTFTDMAGNAASPVVANLVPAASGNTRVVETALFDVTTGGTGTSVGDIVARVIVYDTRTNTIAAAYWHNLTTGAALASAPAAGAIIEQVRNLAAGASTSALQTAGNTSLSNIDGKVPAKGQAAMAASTPVTIASDQSPVPVTQGATSAYAVQRTTGIGTTGVLVSAADTTNRRTVRNTGSIALEIVSALGAAYGTGHPLPAGESFTFDASGRTTAAIYLAAASAGGTASVISY
ncbi:hypothetical protein [Methylobacterium sp. E-046]|uniref:hypothetical protein n=1 Tax=Methylobacterium sp. E-046 TaxID=2836576 RepID=UPI001FBA5D24|nr:hypothetical protein [Methylobacterium sp. E-046]MCJ2102472.1 hypothetical protein [Methylobacterium sp. E-046]